MGYLFKMLDHNIPELLRKFGLIAGISVLIMMVVVLREVIGRYFFSAPTIYSVELSENLMVGLTFLGGPFVMLLDSHVRADILYSKLEGKKKNIVDIFIYLAIIFYLLVLFWQCAQYSWSLLTSWATSSGSLRLPLFPAQVMVTIGVFLTIVECVRKTIHSVLSFIERENE